MLIDIFRIPVVTVGDWDIVKCAQESTHQKLSELEAEQAEMKSRALDLSNRLNKFELNQVI